MTAYRVLVTGSRSWRGPHDRATLRGAFAELLAAHPDLTLVHGACSRGADSLAARWAWDAIHNGANITVEAHPAAWTECTPACTTRPHRQRRADGTDYCPRAGTHRNQLMVNQGADLVMAFVRGNSTGASHCVRAAERAGIPVRRWTA